MSPMLLPSPMAIGPLILEKKIFKGILPYMDMVAILIKWPRCGEHIFVPPAPEGFTWNLALTSPMYSKEKTFEDCRQPTTDRQRDGGACLYYKLTYEPKGSGELIKHQKERIWKLFPLSGTTLIRLLFSLVCTVCWGIPSLNIQSKYGSYPTCILTLPLALSLSNPTFAWTVKA